MSSRSSRFLSHCFRCWGAPEPSSEKYFIDENYDGPWEYLVEKLMITRVPYHIFATSEDFAELNEDDRAHIFKMEGKSLVDKRSKQSADVPIVMKQPGRTNQRTTPSYVTMYGRTPDVRFKRKNSTEDESEEAIIPKDLQRPRKNKPNKSPVSRASNRRGSIDTPEDRGNRPKEIITQMSHSKRTKLPETSGANLQIGADFLNQYSSIFTTNLKDPVPKDPQPINPSNRVTKNTLNVPRNLNLSSFSNQPSIVVKRTILPEISNYSATVSSEESSDDEFEEVDHYHTHRSRNDRQNQRDYDRHRDSRERRDPYDRRRRYYDARHAELKVDHVENMERMENKPEKEVAITERYDLDREVNDLRLDDLELDGKEKGKERLRWKIIIRHRKPQADASIDEQSLDSMLPETSRKLLRSSNVELATEKEVPDTGSAKKSRRVTK